MRNGRRKRRPSTGIVSLNHVSAVQCTRPETKSAASAAMMATSGAHQCRARPCPTTRTTLAMSSTGAITRNDTSTVLVSLPTTSWAGSPAVTWLILRTSTGVSATYPRNDTCAGLLLVVALLRPHVRGQDPFAQPDALRRDLDELVVVDELDGLLEAQDPRRNQADCFVGRRRPHVRLLLLLRDVDVHVVWA